MKKIRILFVTALLFTTVVAAVAYAATMSLSGGTPAALFTQTSKDGDFITLTIPFTITASSGNIYIPSQAALATATSSNATKIEYCVTRQGTCLTTATSGGMIVSEVNYAGTGALSALPTLTPNGNYIVPSGKTLPFSLVVYVRYNYTNSWPGGLYRANLLTIPYASSDVTSGYTLFSGAGLASNTFRTPLIGL
jgi:hypothetical protein